MQGGAPPTAKPAPTAEAAGLYLKAVDEYPDGPLVTDYRLGAVRNYLLVDQIDAAREQADTLEKDFPNAAETKQALRMLSEKSVG